jgi:hypothetical protein
MRDLCIVRKESVRSPGARFLIPPTGTSATPGRWRGCWLGKAATRDAGVGWTALLASDNGSRASAGAYAHLPPVREPMHVDADAALDRVPLREAKP